MDVIGTTAAIVGIVDVLARSIKKLHDLQKQRQGANITLAALMGELTATKAALKELRVSVERHADDEQHYDLIMELDSSLNCCRTLIDYVDARISRLLPATDKQDRPLRERFSLADKLTWILAERENSTCLERLRRIVSALHTVQQSLERDGAAKQHEYLAAPKNCKILKTVHDDSSSMAVILDQSSILSKRAPSTVRSSILARSFGFDSELLSHRLYQNTFRSLIKRIGTNNNTEASVHPAAVEREEKDGHICYAPVSARVRPSWSWSETLPRRSKLAKSIVSASIDTLSVEDRTTPKKFET